MALDELGTKKTAKGSDRGAALLEFAMLLPLLLLVMLGIVDFGWALAQNLDVRHGARETSRLLAVDHFDFTTACNRMDLATGVTITVSRSGGAVLDEATATVTADLNTLTGFFDGWLPSTLTSEVKVLMEQAPTWSTPQTQSCT